VGLRRYSQAIDLLEVLRVASYDSAQVNILLAQSYVGTHESDKALMALREASTLSPLSENPYTFVADACTDHKQYELGLRVTELGLERFSSSARLHYERAMFLAQLDRFEEAKPEFERAAALDTSGDIACLALAQKALFQGDVKTAMETVRSGIRQGHHDSVLETLLAGILIHGGATPGQKGFSEARVLLEDSIAQKPGYSTAQIALGRLYLMEKRYKDAIEHLEIGRRLEPQNQAVYAGLAHAYRRVGEEQKAREMLRQLQSLIEASGGDSGRPQ
jgi:Flp pilus assembly protein TadD